LGLRRVVFGALSAVYPKADWAPRVLRAKSTFESLARNSVEGYLHSVSVIREPMRRSLYSAGLHSQLGGYRVNEVFQRHAQRAGTDDPLALIQYIDLKTYLVGDINTKVDRASMAHSLEVREPLMDHPLVEWLATLPTDMKIKGAATKLLLKKSMESHLPHAVLYRPKMGFAVPLSKWFRGPLRERIRSALTDGSLEQTGWFEMAAVRRLLDEHQSGVRDHSSPLWALLMFQSALRTNGLIG